MTDADTRTPLAPSDAARLHARLTSVRSRLQDRAGGLDDERPIGPDDPGLEPGNDEAGRDVTALLTSSMSDALVAVDVALDRFADGTYGSCASCGGEIPLARLEAVPYAVRCVGCQAQTERER